MCAYEFFKIVSVHRNDLERIGYDTTNVDDPTMRRLASKMADAYCEMCFWIDLEIIAEAVGIPKKKNISSGGGQDE